MAAGDVYQLGITATAQNAYLSFQPGAGTEIVVHNVGHSTDATLEFYDGSAFVAVDSQTGSSAWVGEFLHCTNTKYYRVKNTNAASNNLYGDGVYTK